MSHEYEIDIDKIKNRDKILRRKRSGIARYEPFCTLICALKIGGWRYAEVLEYVHSEYDDMKAMSQDERVDNVQLTKFVSEWKKRHRIDWESVRELKEKIFQVVASDIKPIARGDNVSVFGVSYSKLAFMKELEKRGVSVSQEQDAMITFYSEFANKCSLDELVSQYLAQKSNFIAG